eukprot:scaffold5237_cov154-Skeletonema_marinoi.AAC.1
MRHLRRRPALLSSTILSHAVNTTINCFKWPIIDGHDNEAHWKTPLSLHLHGFLIAFAGMCQRFSDLNWKLDACLTFWALADSVGCTQVSSEQE